MIPSLRQDFNRRYRPETYRDFLRNLDARLGSHVEFRVAETPCFFPKEMLDEMASIGEELTQRLVGNATYLEASRAMIPPQYCAVNETPHPHFMTADFGLVRDAYGKLAPKLVELQAFPSVFGYQFELCEAYRSAFSLDKSLAFLMGGHTESSFWKLMERVIVHRHDPENVVLTEVEPMKQKTLPDFLVTAQRLGIQLVDIAQLVPERQPGKSTRLYYRKDNKLIPVRRIYNRAIVDELIRKRIKLPFDFTESFDVEWAGHPNWYFHISKFSIPYLDYPAVPAAVFLDEWLAGKNNDKLPGDREQWILKPLFSFAGKGIEFAPSDETLDAIPKDMRHEFLLQERVRFEHLIETPFGLTQPEIRILYLWPDGGKLEPVISLVRLGRGKMMGVDHNRDQEWVGGSAAFYPL